MRMGPAAKTVNAYLAPLPPKVRAVLKKLRQTIRATAPTAEERISYGMPGYKYHGPLVYFAAFKDHCSFFPASGAILSKFSRELKAYSCSKGTIRFTIEKPLAVALVKKIVKMRMKQNEERALKMRSLKK